jgi:hypothetical protein
LGLEVLRIQFERPAIALLGFFQVIAGELHSSPVIPPSAGFLFRESFGQQLLGLLEPSLLEEVNREAVLFSRRLCLYRGVRRESACLQDMGEGNEVVDPDFLPSETAILYPRKVFQRDEERGPV